MRHQIYILLISLLIINCNNESKEDTESENLFRDNIDLESVSLNKNLLQEKTLDSINDDSNTAKKTEQNVKIISKTQYLKDFLSEPINLIDFKKRYGPSNSGQLKANKYYYKPKDEGFYYKYMLFNGLGFGKNPMRYLNGKIMSEGDLFNSFQIYVYHFGHTGSFDFYDKNEVLIGFRSAGMHEALGKANLTGKTLQEIEALFGNDYIEAGNIIIYQYNNRVLSLKLKSSKVEWIKYYHQSSKVEKEKIPEHLIIFN